MGEATLKDMDLIQAEALINSSDSAFLLVISFERDGKSYAYSTLMPGTQRQNAEWYKMNATVNIPRDAEDADILKSYIYYVGKNKMWVQGLRISALAEKH